MQRPVIRILLVEDDREDVEFIREILKGEPGFPFELESIERLSAVPPLLAEKQFDIILLDLSLPDSSGLQTFITMNAEALEIPIVILTGLDNSTIAIEAVRRGAQDYLVKGQVDGKVLTRVIRYAVERNKMQMALRGLSLIDELTGLYNRRGFLKLADHYYRLAQRARRGLLLFYMDLDNFKEINDLYGHGVGDEALVKAADILRGTFRSSDIIARLGGDEFTVLTIDVTPTNQDTIIKKLEGNFNQFNAASGVPYKLSLSMGTAYFDPGSSHFFVEQLLDMADKALYAHKRKKR